MATVFLTAPVTLIWDAVTAYEDGDPITAPITYQLATGLPAQTNVVYEGAALTATVPIYKRALNRYWVRAMVNGVESEWSEPYVKDLRRPSKPGAPRE
jgi:hypothetical protein